MAFPSSLSSPVEIPSDTESDDDTAAVTKLGAESFASSLTTQAEVNALCEKHGVPTEFTARPAGERRVCSPPPAGAVCVYAHALETGLRFPLHPFFSKALSHFGFAPSQLTPNGWRVLVGFVVLCHTASVPPSLAVFLHFFSLRGRRGWYFFHCKKAAGALFTGLKIRKSQNKWKRAFFFLTSPEPWPCPVRWGEELPSKISNKRAVLSSEDKKSVAQIVYTHGPAVDLQTYLLESDLAAAFSSHLAGASPPPPLQAPLRSTGSEGMDLSKMDEAVDPAEKVEAEPVGDTPQLSGKKRKHEEVARAKDGLCRSELDSPPAAPPGLRAPPLSGCLAPGCRAPPGSVPNASHMPAPVTHDGDSAGWQEARKVLESIVPPSREREFAAAKPSDVVASTFLAMRQAVSYTSFSLNYTLELEAKQRAQERDAAALRERLEEVNAELTAAKQAAEEKLEKARAELEAARRDTEAEVESAKTAAVQQFLGSKEYTRRVAEQALAAYERGAEDMKLVALRLNPRLDAAKLVLPLD